jgi:hypothetical protein
MNGGNWNLARNVINQLNIRWALGTFKSVGPKKIVLALFSKGPSTQFHTFAAYLELA